MNGDPEIICDNCGTTTEYDRREDSESGLWYLVYKCPKCGKEFKYQKFFDQEILSVKS